MPLLFENAERKMKSIFATIFVSIYYVLNYIKSIPIIYKAIVTKETADYSLVSVLIAYMYQSLNMAQAMMRRKVKYI